VIGTIVKHESATLLRAAQTWVVAALIAGIIGFLFSKQLETFLRVQDQLALRDYPIGLSGFMSERFMSQLPLLFSFIAPLFAMRSFSDEFRQKTFVLWQSSPVSSLSLVLGKFLGISLVLCALAGLSVVMVGALRLAVPLDMGALASATLGLMLCTCACVAVGLFFSSMSEHNLIAIIASLSFLLLLWMAGSVGKVEVSLQWLSYFSISAHLSGFFKGYIVSADIAYFVLLTVLFLALTGIRLDSLRHTPKAH